MTSISESYERGGLRRAVDKDSADWAAKRAGASRPAGHYPTQSEARDAARGFAERSGGGEGRDVTRLGRAVPGLVAKDGAEGVQALALPDGTGMAIKVADGADRARLPVVLAVLESVGVDEAALATVPVPPVLGGGVPVGGLRVSGSARRLLAAP